MEKAGEFHRGDICRWEKNMNSMKCTNAKIGPTWLLRNASFPLYLMKICNESIITVIIHKVINEMLRT